jgi:nitrite reductase (NADH) large subunit
MGNEVVDSGSGVPEALDDPRSSSSPPSISVGAGTIVVVGNGMVSHRLCQRLVEPGPENAGVEAGAGAPRIFVLAEENRPAYDRVRLGEMLGGRRASSLTLATAEWYRARGIQLVLDDPVVSVDRQRRVACTRSGREYPYDHLVFATGAAPVVPEMEIEAPSEVFVIRTTRDLERLRARAAGARRAAVIGGGLLGLETAKSLRDAGMEVTVIEAAPQLMARQLDEEASEVLKGKLERTGLRFVLGETVQRIATCGERRQRLVFAPASQRPPLEVDLVVISMGVRPRDELAVACGLAQGKRGGVAVDTHLRTADPRVFAIGDCAAVDDMTYGLIAPGYRMAEALAGTLLGRPTAFEMRLAPVSLKVAGVEVVTIGQTRRRPSHKTFRFRHNSVYRRVVVEDGRVVGATSVGGWTELGVVQEAIAARRHLDLGWRKRFHRQGTLWGRSASAAPCQREDEVCACANVTAGALMDAIAGGCRSVDELSRATGAARGCGSCLPLVSLMLGQPARARGGARVWLAVFAAAALGGLALALSASPAAFAGILQRRGLDRLMRDPFWQQVSGFTLLGTCLLALLLPLAKRALRVGAGALAVWRAAHAGIGLGALAAVVIHTSLRTGHHLNLALQGAFALLLFLGAAAGLFGLQRGGAVGRALRWAHFAIFWPLLSLIGLHVLAVYYF